ncbi:MAG: biosynthetic arginine decarboxylase [Ectothiorhodospiraceae bacterium]|nr:biosynthetic arginine decarboxylase [Ectothiorhodospiraceae bacterium]
MSWSNEKARALYNVAHWGGGYFDVHEGHLHARLSTQASSIDLHRLADDIQQAGLATPVLVRFPDILQDRVQRLCRAFSTAMRKHEYHGRYTAVYPIKVNQQHSVVSELLSAADSASAEIKVGLECGSKPELLAVIALSASNKKQNTIICNGYKDREYIHLALIGQQLGHHITIVLEKPAELTLVIEESEKLNIQPRLGLRVRLASIGGGNWQNSGGEKSKFGLSATQALRIIQQLRASNRLDCLTLLHCHMGSQLSNIHDIQQGLREIARYYTELHRMGANIRCVDVGGGLGIDYEGSRSRNFCSMNYSLPEYANNVVHTLLEACIKHKLPHPDIITESGRALTAHHAMLITDVIDVEKTDTSTACQQPEEDAPVILHDLWKGLNSSNKHDSRAALETYHMAVHWLAEAQSMYVHGLLSLAQKAQAEELYFAICRRVQTQLNPTQRAHREILDELNEKLADKVFCNFSLFQSLPDVWAIDQIFPIVPLGRLDEQPTRRATLQDITCDSDGRIDHYVNNEGIESSLPLHDISAGENYRLGIFLIGAYQEILGDMHNLFGETNAVDVRLDANGHYQLRHLRLGDTVSDVLHKVQFKRESLLAAYGLQLEQSKLSVDQQHYCLTCLEAGLDAYTYFAVQTTDTPLDISTTTPHSASIQGSIR